MSEDLTRRGAITRMAAAAGVAGLIAASAREARAADAFHHEARGDDLHVEWGTAHKPKVGALTVTFKEKFADPPAVLLTPFWDGDGREVSHVETLEKVTHGEFKLVSDNAADNYYVSWVAIGRKKK
jgi:hypothetical protein